MRVFLNKEGRDIIKKGMDISVNTIKSTLGGAGKTCVIYSGGLVGITKDGVTVARNLVLEGDDNIGACIIRNSTEKQLYDSGDGTTAAAILTQKILEYGFECIERKVDLTELKRGIDLSVDFISNELNEQAEKINGDNEKIKNVATISANNDESIGCLIADAFKEIGHDGDLFIEESKSYDTYVKIQDGFRIDVGYISPYLAQPETMEAELINPYIILFEGKIDKWSSQLKSIMDEIMELKKSRDILIISDNVEGEALQTLIANRIKKVINVTCVRAPYFGEARKFAMEDIAALTGATYISTDRGISTIKVSHTGSCDKVVVTQNDTTIIRGKGDQDEVKKISCQIDSLLKNAKSEYETTMLKQRRAKIQGRLAVISVGAATEAEMKEKKDRVDDSIRSVKSAIESGILPGGGVSLLRCVEKLKTLETKNESQKLGVDIIMKSIEAPLRQILENAGIDNKDEIIAEILSKDKSYGFNVKTGNVENLLKSGVIDAAKVVTTALRNAASVASTVLTAESLIC